MRTSSLMLASLVRTLSTFNDMPAFTYAWYRNATTSVCGIPLRVSVNTCAVGSCYQQHFNKTSEQGNRQVAVDKEANLESRLHSAMYNAAIVSCRVLMNCITMKLNYLYRNCAFDTQCYVESYQAVEEATYAQGIRVCLGAENGMQFKMDSWEN